MIRLAMYGNVSKAGSVPERAPKIHTAHKHDQHIVFQAVEQDTGEPINVAGATVTFDVKTHESDDTTVIQRTTGSGVTTGSDGQISVHLIPADLSIIRSKYAYQLTIVTGGNTYRHRHGRFTVL